MDPNSQLVAEVLEQRWNEKPEVLDNLKIELVSEQIAPPPLTIDRRTGVE
jgi:hypothetical protein